MAATLVRNLQCSLRIPSCNTRFAKLKLTLKTAQLETIFSSCPAGKLFRAIVRGAIVRGSVVQRELFRGNCPGVKTREVIVLGRSSWKNSPGGAVIQVGIVIKLVLFFFKYNVCFKLTNIYISF